MSSTQDRPGVQTSEFKITLVMIAVGVALVLMGREDVAGTVLASVGIGYPVSRGIAKR